MRPAALQVCSLTANKTKLDEFSMVFLNNLLSLPLILMLMYYYGELPSVMEDPALKVLSMSNVPLLAKCHTHVPIQLALNLYAVSCLSQQILS